MRLASAALFVASLVAATYILSTVDALCDSVFVESALGSETSKRALQTGDLSYLLTMPQLWQRFPSPPSLHLERYFDWTALLLTGSFGLAAIGLLRFRHGKNWLGVGLVCLFAAVVPYTVGRFALYDNVELENCGSWLTTMLLGMLYPLLACAACAALAFVAANARLQKAVIAALGPFSGPVEFLLRSNAA